MSETRIDWKRVKTRIQNQQRGSEGLWEKDPKRIREILLQRTQQVAQRNHAKRESRTGIPHGIFILGREHYGIPLKELRGIHPFSQVTPIPGAPASLLGVMHLHGDVLPVLDLANLLGLAPEEHASKGFILVLRNQEMALGLRVDEVLDIKSLSPEEMKSPHAGDPGGDKGFLKGLTSDHTLILDTETFLKHHQLNGGPK